MGDFDGLEADWPLHPEMSSVGRAGVTEDLLVLALDDLRLPSGAPFHVDVAVTLVISRGHPQGDVVVQVWLQAIQAHKQSWEQSPMVE